jgi:DNA modification methylase
MIERIIMASSNEGDVVLDLFSGTGTTTVAAKTLKRNSLGMWNWFWLFPIYYW